MRHQRLQAPGSRLQALIAALAVCGCGADTFQFTPPPLEDARTVVLVFDLQPPRVFALDASDPTQQVAFNFESGDVAVFALLYDRTLSDLRITAGELALDPNGRLLPETSYKIRSATVGDKETPWVEVARPPLLDDLRIKLSGDPCVEAPHFDLTSYELDTKTNGRDLLDMHDGSALLTAFDGSFYTLRASGLERIQLAPNLPSGAVYRAPDGALWFAGKQGALARYENGLVTRTATAPSGGVIQRIDGPKDATAPFELLLLDFTTSSLMRYDGASFTELSRDFAIEIGDLAWTSPGHGYAVRGSRSTLTVIEGVELRDEDLQTGTIGANSLAIHPTLGLFVGTVNGRLMHKKDGAWIMLGDLGANVESIAPYEGGVILGGTNGFFGFWSERTGLCTDQIFPATVEKLLPIVGNTGGSGGGDVAATLLNLQWSEPAMSSQPTYASWLKRSL